MKKLILISIALLAVFTTNTAKAQEYEAFDCAMLWYVANGEDNTGTYALLKRSFMESSAFESLYDRVMNCQSLSGAKAKELIKELESRSLGGSLYHEVRFMEGGLIAVRKDLKQTNNSKWGLLDSKGILLVPYSHTTIDFADKMRDVVIFADADKNGEWLYGASRISNGKQILPAKFKNISLGFGNYLIAGTYTAANFYDFEGKKLLPFDSPKIEDYVFRYDRTSTETKFYFVKNKTGKSAFYDQNLNRQTEFKYALWANEKPYIYAYPDKEGKMKADVIDTRYWRIIPSIPASYWDHRWEEE